MKKIEISKEEKEWRAEEDMRTLMEYQKLMKDEERKEAAIKKLKEREKQIKQAIKDTE